MRAEKKKDHGTFINERNPVEQLHVMSTNFGEPYDHGIRFQLRDESKAIVTVDLCSREMRDLHTLIGRLIDKER